MTSEVMDSDWNLRRLRTDDHGASGPNRRHAARWVLGLLLFAHLVPIWAFPFLPTQDGPAHVMNSLILKELSYPQRRYAEFFVLEQLQIPNVAVQLTLAGLMHVVSPRTAERLLVSGYLIGFVLSYGYFLRGLGDDREALMPIAVLCAWSTCFFMGFYSFCLGLIFLWLALGMAVRHRHSGWNTTALLQLALVFQAAYWTHLIAFLLSFVGVITFSLFSPRRPLRQTFASLICTLPALVLVIEYWWRTGFFNGASQAMQEVQLSHLATRFGDDVASIHIRLFQPHDIAYGVLGHAVLLWGALLGALAFTENRPQPSTGVHPQNSWGLWALMVAVTAGYFLLPDFFGDHGGHLKPRLALVALMLFLALLRLPRERNGRRVAFATMGLLLAVNLFLVTTYFLRANREIKEYTAGIPHLRSQQTIFVDQEAAYRQKREPSPLEHAADYYALAGSHVNLDNYQAEKSHFPLAFRPGVSWGRGAFLEYPHPEHVDVVLAWDRPQDRLDALARVGRCVFSGGRLHIFEMGSVSAETNTTAPRPFTSRRTTLVGNRGRQK